MIQTYFCKPADRKYKKFTQPSMTLPDQTLSIREILHRYTRGIPMQGKAPIFEEDFVPDPRTLDLTEIQAELDVIRERTREKMTEKQQKKAAEAAAKQKAYEDDLIKKALEAQKSPQIEPNPKPTNE